MTSFDCRLLVSIVDNDDQRTDVHVVLNDVVDS
jgi:hypothetical protein